MSRWISAFAPMSMPRVGSSRISSCGIGGQPPGEQHLLLVAARQVADQRVRVGRADAERLHVLADDPGLLRLRDATEPSALRLHAEHEVLGDGEVADDALFPSVLRREGDALVDRMTRAGQPRRRTSDRDPSVVGPVGAVDEPREFRAARAEQAGDADHFAVVDLEVERLDRALPSEQGRAGGPGSPARSTCRSADRPIDSNSASSRPSMAAISSRAADLGRPGTRR